MVSATLFHLPLLFGFLLGYLDLEQVVLGTLLTNLVRISIWTPAALHRRRGSSVKVVLAEACLVIIGISLGVWGYVGVIKGAGAGDFSYLGLNYAGLELLGELDLSNLGELGDDEGGGEVFLVLLAIAALALFCYSMFLLYEVIGAGDPTIVGILLMTALVVESLAYLRHQQQAKTLPADATDQQEHHNLRLLARMMFVKGWVGALLIGLFQANHTLMVLGYIGWSWLYESFAEQLWKRWFPAPKIALHKPAKVDIAVQQVRNATLDELEVATKNMSSQERRAWYAKRAADKLR